MSRHANAKSAAVVGAIWEDSGSVCAIATLERQRCTTTTTTSSQQSRPTSANFHKAPQSEQSEQIQLSIQVLASSWPPTIKTGASLHKKTARGPNCATSAGQSNGFADWRQVSLVSRARYDPAAPIQLGSWFARDSIAFGGGGGGGSDRRAFQGVPSLLLWLAPIWLTCGCSPIGFIIALRPKWGAFALRRRELDLEPRKSAPTSAVFNFTFSARAEPEEASKSSMQMRIASYRIGSDRQPISS